MSRSGWPSSSAKASATPARDYCVRSTPTTETSSSSRWVALCQPLSAPGTCQIAATLQLYVYLLGLGLLGNPYRLAQNFATGIEDVFVQPVKVALLSRPRTAPIYPSLTIILFPSGRSCWAGRVRARNGIRLQEPLQQHRRRDHRWAAIVEAAPFQQWSLNLIAKGGFQARSLASPTQWDEEWRC